MNATDLAARLDRLPVTGFHRRVLLGLAGGFFFELADLNTFSYAAPALKQYVGISVDDIAVVTSLSFLGMFLGAALGGRIADRVGRRRGLIGSIVWYSLFSLLNAAAWNVPTLGGARLLTGMGLGAMTVIAITYLSELMPRDRRGRMQSATLAAGLAGIPVMAFIARGVIPIGPEAWRIVFVFGALGVVSLAIIVRLPESPRWLLQHRGADRAEEALAGIEAAVERQVGALPETPASGPAEEPAPAGFGALFRGRLLPRTLLLLVAWIFQTLGFYGFVSWVPTLLAEHGFNLEDSLTFSALTTIGAVPGALLAWPISDRYGRKASTAVVAVLIAICGVLYGVSFNQAAIVVFGFAVSFFIQTFAALLYAYTPELYPTALRNTGSGFAYGTGRLANIVGPLIVAAIFSGAGYVWVFVYISACWLVVAVAVGIFGPRTSAVALEDLQA